MNASELRQILTSASTTWEHVTQGQPLSVDNLRHILFELDQATEIDRLSIERIVAEAAVKAVQA